MIVTVQNTNGKTGSVYQVVMKPKHGFEVSDAR